ncbi:MAG: NUDIX domain-containing protein [Planctomycetota bacterium]|nr:NUDIX domain-containing protein [Planctomycetota bacterium]MDG2143464.1 NUDIX domain-containing protein [Planctomycetota bacterium]
MWQDHAKYCPLCSADLETRSIDGQSRLACVSCRFVLYTGPAAASAAVVLDDERRVLLVRRAIEPYLGDWALPAGYQDLGETAEMAAIREVLEETGIRVEVIRLLALLHIPDDPRKPANAAVFLCKIRPDQEGANLSAGDDASDARWFSLDDLPPNLGFPNNRQILDSL